MQANSSDLVRLLMNANDLLNKQNYLAALDIIDSNWDFDDMKEAKMIRIRALIGLERFVEVRRDILFCDVIREDIELREQLVKEYKDAIDQHGITDNFVWDFDVSGFHHGIDDDPIALDALKKADALFNDKKLEDACLQYSIALERNLRTPQIYLKRATCFYELKEYAKAMEDARGVENAVNGLWADWDDTTYNAQGKVIEIRSAIEIGNFDDARWGILYNESIRSDQILREQLILEYKKKLAELNIDDETDWNETENDSVGNRNMEDPVTQHYLKQADVQFQQQNWSDAIVLYNKALGNMKNPNHLYLKRGQCYFALGDFQTAYDDFVWCDARGLKIRTMIALKRYEEAYPAIINFFENSEETVSRKELAEEWEEALANDGNAFLINIIKSTTRSEVPNQNDDQSMELEPAASYSGYRVVSPDISDYKSQEKDDEKAARTSLANKEYDKAKRQFSSLIAEKAKAEYFVGRADCCLELKEFVQALEDVQMALNLEPSYLEALILNGRVLSSLGRYEDAEHICFLVRQELNNQRNHNREELMKKVELCEIENITKALLSMGFNKDQIEECSTKTSLQEAVDSLSYLY